MYEYEKNKFKKYLGTEVYDILKSYNCIVAGGSVLSIFTNNKINDIDVYFRRKEDLSNFLYNEMSENWIVAYTDKALLFRKNGMDIQLIYFKYFETPNDLFNTFDFTVCMGAFDFTTEEFVLHEDFLRNNISKTLKFNSSTAYPIVSALRVQKYKDKGFNISKAEFIKILLTVMKLKIDNYDDLKAQMGGMYGENYDLLLKPKEGEEFDLLKIIDKISKIGETNFNDTYVRFETGADIDDFDEFIEEILGEKRVCFKNNDKFYKISQGKIKEISKEKAMNCTLKDVNDVLNFPITLYKFVEHKNGKLYSFYDNKYEWKIGEYNYPNSKERGVFASKLEDIDSSTYSSERNGVCVEVQCECFDDIIFNWRGEVKEYKKLKAIRILSKEEYNKLTNMNLDTRNFIFN